MSCPRLSLLSSLPPVLPLIDTNLPYRALHSDFSPPSSWTAINQSTPDQSYIPQVSASANYIQHAATSGKRRRRDPAVAQYLGLGTLRTEVQPSQVDSSASTPMVLPPPASSSRGTTQRKRNRRTQGAEKTQKQRRILDGLRVTKSTSRQPLTSKDTQDGLSSPAAPSDVKNDVSLSQEITSARNIESSSRALNLNVYTQTAVIVPNSAKNSDLLPAEHSSGDETAYATLLEVQPIRSSLYNFQNAAEYFDDGLDEIFGSIDFENFTDTDCATDGQVQGAPETPITSDFDDTFDDGLDDDDLLRLTTDLNDDFHDGNNRCESLCSSSGFPSPLLDSGADRSASEIIHLTEAHGPSSQFIPPVKRNTRARAQDADRNEHKKPIVRPSFPSQVRDRSPIIGLSPNTRLRTCFRIGEAINTGRHAVRDGKGVILELYARVLSSARDSSKQSFVFCDLYHTNPPYINAVYDAAIWRSNSQFNYDSRRLLQEMAMCRCIGRMKREGKEWILVILTVWEASWEDITWVEGIVNV